MICAEVGGHQTAGNWESIDLSTAARVPPRMICTSWEGGREAWTRTVGNVFMERPRGITTLVAVAGLTNEIR